MFDQDRIIRGEGLVGKRSLANLSLLINHIAFDFVSLKVLTSFCLPKYCFRITFDKYEKQLLIIASSVIVNQPYISLKRFDGVCGTCALS